VPQMDMRGERILPADRATVWSLLNDPEILRQCVPGCESLVATAEHSYDVAMTAAVGPVRARFKGKLSLADIEAPLRYRLLFDGQSSQAGFARGEATVEPLEPPTSFSKPSPGSCLRQPFPPRTGRPRRQPPSLAAPDSRAGCSHSSGTCSDGKPEPPVAGALD